MSNFTPIIDFSDVDGNIFRVSPSESFIGDRKESNMVINYDSEDMDDDSVIEVLDYLSLESLFNSVAGDGSVEREELEVNFKYPSNGSNNWTGAVNIKDFNTALLGINSTKIYISDNSSFSGGITRVFEYKNKVIDFEIDYYSIYGREKVVYIKVEYEGKDAIYSSPVISVLTSKMVKVKTVDELLLYVNDDGFDLNNIDTSELKSLYKFYSRVTRSASLEGMKNWDVSEVEDFRYAFGLTESGITAGQRYTDLGYLQTAQLDRNYSNFNVDIFKWKVKSIKYADYMFFGCCRLPDFYNELDWDFSNLETARYMFAFSVGFDSNMWFRNGTDFIIKIFNSNLKKLVDATGMFAYSTMDIFYLNESDLDKLRDGLNKQIPKLAKAESMFEGCRVAPWMFNVDMPSLKRFDCMYRNVERIFILAPDVITSKKYYDIISMEATFENVRDIVVCYKTSGRWDYIKPSVHDVAGYARNVKEHMFYIPFFTSGYKLACGSNRVVAEFLAILFKTIATDAEYQNAVGSRYIMFYNLQYAFASIGACATVDYLRSYRGGEPNLGGSIVTGVNEKKLYLFGKFRRFCDFFVMDILNFNSTVSTCVYPLESNNYGLPYVINPKISDNIHSTDYLLGKTVVDYSYCFYGNYYGYSDSPSVSSSEQYIKKIEMNLNVVPKETVASYNTESAVILDGAFMNSCTYNGRSYPDYANKLTLAFNINYDANGGNGVDSFNTSLSLYTRHMMAMATLPLYIEDSGSMFNGRANCREVNIDKFSLIFSNESEDYQYYLADLNTFLVNERFLFLKRMSEYDTLQTSDYNNAKYNCGVLNDYISMKNYAYRIVGGEIFPAFYNIDTYPVVNALDTGYNSYDDYRTTLRKWSKDIYKNLKCKDVYTSVRPMLSSNLLKLIGEEDWLTRIYRRSEHEERPANTFNELVLDGMFSTNSYVGDDNTGNIRYSDFFTLKIDVIDKVTSQSSNRIRFNGTGIAPEGMFQGVSSKVLGTYTNASKKYGFTNVEMFPLTPNYYTHTGREFNPYYGGYDFTGPATDYPLLEKEYIKDLKTSRNSSGLIRMLPQRGLDDARKFSLQSKVYRLNAVFAHSYIYGLLNTTDNDYWSGYMDYVNGSLNTSLPTESYELPTWCSKFISHLINDYSYSGGNYVDISCCFYGRRFITADHVTNIGSLLSSTNSGKVKAINFLFGDAIFSNNTKIAFSTLWDVSKVKSARGLFMGTAVNSAVGWDDLSGFRFTNLEDASYMFVDRCNKYESSNVAYTKVRASNWSPSKLCSAAYFWHSLSSSYAGYAKLDKFILASIWNIDLPKLNVGKYMFRSVVFDSGYNTYVSNIMRLNRVAYSSYDFNYYYPDGSSVSEFINGEAYNYRTDLSNLYAMFGELGNVNLNKLFINDKASSTEELLVDKEVGDLLLNTFIGGVSRSNVNSLLADKLGI